jgi:hypothetical protein
MTQEITNDEILDFFEKVSQEKNLGDSAFFPEKIVENESFSLINYPTHEQRERMYNFIKIIENNSRKKIISEIGEINFTEHDQDIETVLELILNKIMS